MCEESDSSVQMEEDKPYPTPPKLALSSSFPSFMRRSTLNQPSTPPIRLQGAIPFLWEEKPGKPRKQLVPAPKLERSGTVQEETSLSLPPRLAIARTKISSPTSVMDGPYKRSISIRRLPSLSFRKKKKIVRRDMMCLERSSSTSISEEEEKEEPTLKSSASNYLSSSLHSSSTSSFKSFASASSSMSSCCSYGSGESNTTDEEKDERVVRIVRCRVTKRSPATCLTSYTHSLLRASIFRRLKMHAACWRNPNF